MTDMTLTPADRVAPNSSEAEEAVLGSVLINPDSYHEVSYLKPEDFFIVRNSWVWEAIIAVFTRGHAIDNLTVVQELAERERLETVGGSAYITRLINNTPTHIHADTYAAVVKQAAIRRMLLTAAGDIATMALNGTAETNEIVSQAQRRLEEVAMERTIGFVTSGYEVIDQAQTEFEDWLAFPTEIRGFRSGIPDLDRVVGGFIPGSRPYTLYGATGMGKTRLAGHIGLNLMEQGPGMVVTTETDPVRWVHRMVANLVGISYKDLRSGQLDRAQKEIARSIYDRFKRLAPKYFMLPISDPSPEDIKANVRRLLRQGACEWMLLDSVNNVTVPGVKEIYQRTTIAAACTLSVGIDLGVVVIQTAQTGRNSKNRDSNKMPQIEDAKGSGDIEQNSGVVIGLYRHDYYVKRRVLPRGNTFPVGNTTLVMLKNDQGDEGGWIPLRIVNGEYIYDERMSTPHVVLEPAEQEETTQPQPIDLEGF